MPSPDTTPDDRPLTIADIEDGVETFVLADRVITHLGPGWEARRMLAHDAMLMGPDGMKFLLTPYGGTDYDPHQMWIGTYTLSGRPRHVEDAINIFTLPSQIAAHLTSKLIPETRKRHEAARRQQAKVGALVEARKAFIQRIAERLDWNSSSFKCHSRDPYPSLSARVGRRRSREAPPVRLEGHVSYADNGTMTVAFAGIPEVLADQIVDLVAAHYAPPTQRRWPRKAPRLTAQTRSAGHTGAEE